MYIHSCGWVDWCFLYENVHAGKKEEEVSWSQWMLSNWESKVIRWLISLLITTKPLKIFQFLAKFRFSFYPFSSNICQYSSVSFSFYICPLVAARLSWKASTRFCSYSSWIIATCFKRFNSLYLLTFLYYLTFACLFLFTHYLSYFVFA